MMDIKNIIPSLDEFITDEYISSLLTSGQWSNHGSSLCEFIEDIIDIEDFLPQSLYGLPVEDILQHQDFYSLLKSWLPKRYNYVISEIEDELKGRDQIIIKRCAYLSREVQECILEGGKPNIGKYWSTGHVEAWGVMPEEDKFETVVTAEVNPEDIDWVETLRSRMDYMNGDQEQEIQLKSDAQPNFLSLLCRTTKEKREL